MGASPILTHRVYSTTFEEDRRNIDTSEPVDKIKNIMRKDDFTNARKAELRTEWKRVEPHDNQHEFVLGMGKWLYEYGGDLTVTLTDFDGSTVLLYERRGARLEHAMEKHVELTALFYDGRLK
jgi:hypothetical protein